MALVSGVTKGEQAAREKLTLKRKHVAFVVRHLIVMKEVRRGIHRNVVPKIDFRMRVFGRRIQRGRRKWKTLTRIRAVSCRNERFVKQRRSGAQIVVSIRGNA